jgi:hypothetical protein
VLDKVTDIAAGDPDVPEILRNSQLSAGKEPDEKLTVSTPEVVAV